MRYTYWYCGSCRRPFKVSTLAMNYIEKSHQPKPHCRFCGSMVTNKTSKDEYEKYLLKKDIKRDKTICKSLDVWFDGGSMPYLKKKERDDK